MTFVGVQFPGIDRIDYLGLHAAARQIAFFMSPSVRAGLAAGRAELSSLDYPGNFPGRRAEVWADVSYRLRF